MAKKSAGLLLYRINNNVPEVLLVHPGGPFFRNKDEGVWSIPKGEYNDDEDPLTVAIREFTEETGNVITATSFQQLAFVKLSSGKIITAWAVEQDLEQPFISSNLFEMEWPPRSGKQQSFPETDNAAWFDLETAMKKMYPSQHPFIAELKQLLKLF
jgi:predicted NUDIX family NTP pyrophosphohydrolase